MKDLRKNKKKKCCAFTVVYWKKKKKMRHSDGFWVDKIPCHLDTKKNGQQMIATTRYFFY